MVNNFRNHQPSRTCLKTYIDYSSFKPYLVKDFIGKCGYTDCSDFWFGGKNNFHIDHFIPWKSYPTQPNLKTDYSNLVYACSYVNILKSNDEGDYIDPCMVDFNLHFYRDINGSIFPVKGSKAGIYMHHKLKLFLVRYRIIWVLERLHQKMSQVKSTIDKLPDSNLKDELRKVQGDLANLMLDYLNYLQKTQ